MPENHTFLGGSGLIIPKEVGALPRGLDEVWFEGWVYFSWCQNSV